jgi:uncharacterized lipoprotein NlpE involved in copper resistance
MKIIVALLLVTLLGCNSRHNSKDDSSAGQPRSSYGQSVKKAKDLSGGLHSRDQDVDKQAKELADQ